MYPIRGTKLWNNIVVAFRNLLITKFYRIGSGKSWLIRHTCVYLPFTRTNYDTRSLYNRNENMCREIKRRWSTVWKSVNTRINDVRVYIPLLIVAEKQADNNYNTNCCIMMWWIGRGRVKKEERGRGRKISEIDEDTWGVGRANVSF